MGTSSPNTGSAPKRRLSGGGGYAPDPTACEPPISDPLNSSTAHDEGKGKERVDAAAPGQNNAAWLPPTCNCNPGSGYNFSSFAMSLLTEPAEGGDNNIQAFHKFGVIDMIRFLEEKMKETHTLYRSQIATLTDQHQQVTEIESRSMSTEQELSMSLKSVIKKFQARVSSTKSCLTAAESQLQDRNMAAQMMQGELDKLNAQNGNLSKSLGEMTAMKTKLNRSLQAEAQKVHRLNNIIQEKAKAIGEKESATKLLVSDCEKLKAQIATFELKGAQESLASGSYADDQANPAMLETACQSVDRAIENLIRFLHEKSITKVFSLKSVNSDVERFIGSVSRAKPADFTRPAQVRHVWGHWICAKMFQGFEHVFFDVGEERTSPLDSRKHATECFRSFQEKKCVSPSDYYNACDLFREFCAKMYSLCVSVRFRQVRAH